jgi:orotate phosphoribosyltransferase
MTDPAVMTQMKRDGFLREGHFAFRSGRHTGVLLDRDLLLTDPRIAAHMGYAIAKRFFTDKVETVATPSIWGAGLAQWVGYFLDPKAKLVNATPKERNLSIAPHLEELINGQRVLLVDNVVITGQTMTEFANLIAQFGGTILGIGSIWNVGGDMVAGLPVMSLLETHYDSYTPEECPLCAAGQNDPDQVDY